LAWEFAASRKLQRIICQKWKTGLSDAANITAFGWNQTEVTATLGAADAFLTARAK
jgi:hypothetical protein